MRNPAYTILVLLICGVVFSSMGISNACCQATTTETGSNVQESLPTDDSKSKPSTRMIAEWEQAVGTMIAWPLSVPDELVVELAKDAKLFVLVNPDKLEAAQAKMESLEIDSKRVQFVPCSVESNWPRDWGPHQIFRPDGVMSMINHRFDGYPVYPQSGDKAEFMFRSGAGDDSVCPEVAQALGYATTEFPAYLTGGNFLIDGHGTAFCTRAQLTENQFIADEKRYRRLLSRFLGVERLIVLENTEPIGIQHIDCWMKVLDAERLLIKRAPEGHPEAAALERNIQTISQLKNAFGRPYEIIRIDCPEVPVKTTEGEEAAPIAAYTNSLIVNGNVYVPLFGVEGDQAAIKTWQDALPGYEVKGFTWDRWKHFDALHCRTRAIFDQRLLRLDHAALPKSVPFSNQGHEILVTLEDMDGEGIDSSQCMVKFRADQGEWKSLPLVALSKETRWMANLPSFPVGTQVDYQIIVKGNSGQTSQHPRMAPKVFHQFSVTESE